LNPWLAALLLLAATGVVGFLIAGPARVWSLFGPADLGPVAFETLRRRSTPNDALACPAGVCSAKIDIVPPVYAVSAADLARAFDKAIASEPRLMLVDSSGQSASRRYIQRSRLLGFPDTIVVRFIALAGGHATLALYSRSQLGKGDLGVNRARIARWLVKIGQEVPVARSCV